MLVPKNVEYIEYSAYDGPDATVKVAATAGGKKQERKNKSSKKRKKKGGDARCEVNPQKVEEVGKQLVVRGIEFTRDNETLETKRKNQRYYCANRRGCR